jgi:hypothetical protein
VKAKPRLSIITPCARPQNLAKISKELAQTPSIELFDSFWFIVHDCLASPCNFKPVFEPMYTQVVLLHWMAPGSVVGHGQVNHVLDLPHLGWVWRLDDDNLPARGFFFELAREIERSPQASVIIFGQQRDGQYVRPVARVRETDSAQYVYRRDALGPIRLRQQDYVADGYFVEDLVARVGSAAVVMVDEPLTRYNALA